MKCLGLLCLSEFAKVSETSLRRFIRKLLDTCYKPIHHILSVLKKMIIYLLRFFFHFSDIYRLRFLFEYEK